MADTNNFNLDTSQIAAIEDYSREYGRQLMNEILEEKNNGFFSNITFNDEFVHHRTDSTEIIQASQPDMHPKGVFGLSGRVQKNKAWKGDIKLAPRDYHQSSYLAKFVGYTNDPYNMPLFSEWVLRNLYARIVDDEVMNVQWTGVEQPVITGFPNAAQDVCDGLLELRRKAIQTGEVIPYGTGSITAANSLDKLEEFLDWVISAPKYEGRQMGIFVPFRHLRWIRNLYRSTYGTYIHAQEYNMFTLDSHPNVRMIAQAGLESSSAWVATYSDNVYVGSAGSMSVKIEQKDRYLDILVDGKVSYDFADGRKFWTNDQV